MPDLLWQAQAVHLHPRAPHAGQLARALHVSPDVAELVLRAMHAPTTEQVDRDRFMVRARVMP